MAHIRMAHFLVSTQYVFIVKIIQTSYLAPIATLVSEVSAEFESCQTWPLVRSGEAAVLSSRRIELSLTRSK